jgi:hypothetical protein
MLNSLAIQALIARFNNELDRMEEEAIKGLQLAEAILERFAHDATLIQLRAFLNNAIFFVNTQKIRVRTIVDRIAILTDDYPDDVRELTEELDRELSQILETKMIVASIVRRLKKLQ